MNPKKISKKKLPFIFILLDRRVPKPAIEIEKTPMLKKNKINSNTIIKNLFLSQLKIFTLSKITIGINLNPVKYFLIKRAGLNINLTNQPR